MKLYRKLLIFLIVVISLIIVYRFITTRFQIQSKPYSYLEGIYITIEGMQSTTAQNEAQPITKKYSTIPVGIINAKKTDLPLCQYFIKASANSAYSGSYVSTDMVKTVLSRGCRFLDFQVFVGKDAKTGNSAPMVGVYGKGGEIISLNQVNLSDVFKNIVINGMTNAPNPTDPLFIQLRIYPDSPIGGGSNSTKTTSSIYEMIGLAIQTNLASTAYLYKPDSNPMINSSTPLSKLIGKIILIVDVSLTPNYTDTTHYSNDSNNLKHFVAMETGTTDIPSYDYQLALTNIKTPVFIQSSQNHMTNISKCSVIIPGGDIVNPDFVPFVKNYGYNIVTYQYGLTDNANAKRVGQYEAVFGATDGSHTPSGFNTAFVQMSDMLQLVK